METICGKRSVELTKKVYSYLQLHKVFLYVSLQVKESLNIEQDAFGSDEVFPEAQVGKMGKSAMKILGMKDEEFYEGMGRYFVTLAKQVGYERTLLQLGRGLRCPGLVYVWNKLNPGTFS